MLSSSLSDLSSLSWLHIGTDSSFDILNKLVALNSNDSFKDGDFFVMTNEQNNSSLKSVFKRIYYLIVFSSRNNKWLTFEIIEESSKRKLLNSYKREFYLNLREQSSNATKCYTSIADLISHHKNVKINTHEISFKNGMSKQELKQKMIDCIKLEENKSKPAPRKPIRMPTIKTTKKPETLLNRLVNTNHSERDINDIPLSVNSNVNDINAAKCNLNSLYHLKTYQCDIISNRAKKLDRLALIEINRALQLKTAQCCDSCSNLAKNSAVYLAKYLTFEDLRVLRFNYDFGLGIFTGLEMITLPQGSVIRIDTIERSKSCTLFIALMIVLCQNSTDRIDLIIKLVDCAVVLFDKLNNLYAFAYIIEAFNHPNVKRLSETWLLLKRDYENKFILMNNLNEKFISLNRGEFHFLEQNALIPNLYPIAVLLCNEQHTMTYASNSEVYLSLNGRYFAANSLKYASKCELFIQNEYNELFPNKKRDHCLELFKKYSYFAQTEFQQIIMWSDDESFDSLKKTNDINQLIEILSLKIQP